MECHLLFRQWNGAIIRLLPLLLSLLSRDPCQTDMSKRKRRRVRRSRNWRRGWGSAKEHIVNKFVYRRFSFGPLYLRTPAIRVSHWYYFISSFCWRSGPRRVFHSSPHPITLSLSPFINVELIRDDIAERTDRIEIIILLRYFTSWNCRRFLIGKSKASVIFLKFLDFFSLFLKDHKLSTKFESCPFDPFVLDKIEKEWTHRSGIHLENSRLEHSQSSRGGRTRVFARAEDRLASSHYWVASFNYSLSLSLLLHIFWIIFRRFVFLLCFVCAFCKYFPPSLWTYKRSALRGWWIAGRDFGEVFVDKVSLCGCPRCTVSFTFPEPPYKRMTIFYVYIKIMHMHFSLASRTHPEPGNLWGFD